MYILILSESFKINNHSSAIVSSTFIEVLQQSSHDITLLYPEFFSRNDESQEPIWLEVNKKSSFTFSQNTESFLEKFLYKIPKVRALPSYINGFNKFFNRFVSDWKIAIANELKANKYDLVIVLGTGSSFAPHFAMAEGNFDVKWIANLHDPYPMNQYPYPYRKKDTLLYKKQAKRMKNVVDKANFVAFPSLRLKEWMQNFYPKLENKSIILPHAAISLNNLPGTEEDKEVVLNKNKFNLLHAGSLLGPRSPKVLLKAFLRFIGEDKERQEQCVLNIIGKVAREWNDFEKEYETFNKNINIVTKRVSYKHSHVLLKQADVLILLEANSEESPFMPGKLADYVVADKPILAMTPKMSETSRLLGAEYPYVTENNDADEVYKILIQLWTNWKNGLEQSLSHTSLQEYLSKENINNTLMEMIHVNNR